jgi:type II restriction/modification system DNA methylase subunit YeeA
MTPHDFIDKWRDVELKERAASQSHFNDICALLSLHDPVSADKKGEWFTFEKGASKSTGGEGWADVWRKGCFAWEYKGKKKDLGAAFIQLQQYAVALENPPLLIVSDMERFRIHTNWTNTVQKTHEFTIHDLTDGATRDLLRNAFEAPEKLRPAKTRQMLTEEAAKTFADLAQRLRTRGHDAETVAHFVNRLIFCMFAEDVNLLPKDMFTRMLEASVNSPTDFTTYASALFAAMRSGGMVGFERVEWFNGGLFDSAEALTLDKEDARLVLTAAKLDWSDVDPSILGTLFERGLDPDKRSQLGAHYTDRDKIMQIVNPVIVEPLSREWTATKAKIEAELAKEVAAKSPSAATKAHNQAVRLHIEHMERLKGFRVLDPACGSGNFLYLSLLSLKDLEHRINLEAEALGLGRGFPTVGPEAVQGIEINPYAAELARVSVWIGEIQWMRRNGFEASRNPILKPLSTIECRDAVLNADGTRAEWPKADVVVGNPPFLGNKKMIEELGEDYANRLRAAWKADVPGAADLVCYWFAQAWGLIAAERLQRAGLVATNSIRGGASREVLKPVVEKGRIFEAWGDEEWTVDGAAVRVSLVCFDGERGGAARLDGSVVGAVFSDLMASDAQPDLTFSSKLNENKNMSFQGVVKVGPFDVEYEKAVAWIQQSGNPNLQSNSDVVRPWANGLDITRRPSGKWIVDFGVSMAVQDASMYEAPFKHVLDNVKPQRESVRRVGHREKWWVYGESRKNMRTAIGNFDRYLVSPRVSKYRLFIMMDVSVVPDCQLVVIARDDDTALGILHSCVHEIWSLRMGTSLEDRPRYTPSTTFETFPFPQGLTPNIPAADYADDPRAQKIAAAAERLNTLRENWLNPPDLINRVPEVVAGYPDRILPKDDAAAAILKKRTLTNLYNARPTWLDNAHKILDEAVAEAYGWGDDWRAGLLTDDEIVARLFALNQQRAAQGR